MSKSSKRMRAIYEQINKQDNVNKTYSVNEALELLKALPAPKFMQSVEIDICLNLKKSDQGVRSAVVLPHGTGRQTRVIALSEDKAQVEKALAEGAALAGFEELINEIKQGDVVLGDKDTLIATPGVMRLLMPLGPILGPKGLMPNPKLGTVTNDLVTAVREALLGRVQYRSDKGGVVRCLVGKLSLSVEELKANLNTLFANVLKNKPDTISKGRVFVKKVTLSSTMGPGLVIDQSSLDFDTAS